MRDGSASQYSGRPMADDGQQEQRPPQGAVEARALEDLVVEVRLAVGRELDLGGDLGAAGADVDGDVPDEADHHEDGDHGADGLHRAGGQHGWEQLEHVSVTPAHAVGAFGLLPRGVRADRRTDDDRAGVDADRAARRR